MGKDVTAFWQAGGRVRDWVRFELARLPVVVNRAAVAVAGDAERAAGSSARESTANSVSCGLLGIKLAEQNH